MLLLYMYHTGRYDSDGSFYITDRLKELIKVKGLQVAPAELEAVLVSHPKISDAAVTSIPDERQGEAPKAFIVKKDEGLTEKEVMEFMAGKVRERERERERCIAIIGDYLFSLHLTSS